MVQEDVAALAELVNPYLLGFYFFAIGKSEAWFLERIRKTQPAVSNKVAGG